VEKNNLHGIVLVGRPYHIDPEINHNIDRVIVGLGMAVLTEDAVANINQHNQKLRVINQWVYHSRVYDAANFVGQSNFFDLIQLNSFGCGIDAVICDQVKEIVEHHNKIYTCLKIDEGSNLGAAKIRIRSLQAAIDEREALEIVLNTDDYKFDAVIADDLSDYTLLAPQMSPVHFKYIEMATNHSGYKLKVLPAVDKLAIEIGLKYVNNDACYPALVVIGQLLHALEEYDLDKDKVALVMSQTGGGCRASNYIALIRRALISAGYANVPVFSVSSGNI
jgi:predicted nucleotide-binding protein (sugar kinase/HSP70/actin superfamily)